MVGVAYLTTAFAVGAVGAIDKAIIALIEGVTFLALVICFLMLP